jgi:putative flavoprotein involved in K+ transport
VVAYLERYARHHNLDLMLGSEVTRVDRSGDGWVVRTESGDIEAGDVVVATGYNNTPVFPDWPGRDAFTGEIVHASRYRNAEPYRGRDALVVGSGNTGAEIAVDLAEQGAGRVRLAVRTPPNIVLREANGVPAPMPGVLLRYAPPKLADAMAFAIRRREIGDLEQYGLPLPERGVFTRVREDDAIPIVDVGLVDMVRAGHVEVVAGVAGFDGSKVLLADGSAIEPEAVIVATGWERALEPLVGHLGVLGPRGRPVVDGARQAPQAPRLWFIGFTNPPSGMFRQLNIDSRRIARAMSRLRRAAG